MFHVKFVNVKLKLFLLFLQNAVKNSLLQRASDEQMKADESVMKLAEDQKVTDCDFLY